MKCRHGAGSAVCLMMNLILWSVVKSSSECPAKCECKWKSGKESVVCLSGSLQHIPQGLEPTTQVLDLSGNPLKHLGASAFRQVGLYNLQKALLQRCGLRGIDGAAFQGLTNLVEIDASHNLLSQVPSQALASVPQLRELKLNNNPLEKLDDHVFAAASQLVRLELSACQISVIQPRAFHGLELLEWLRLDGNLIELMPPASLLSLRTIRGLDLHNNPWICSCALRPVRSWIDARNLPFSIPPLCFTPSRLRGQPWNRLEPEELACRPNVEAGDNPVQAVTNRRARLVCHVRGFPDANIDWFFNEGRLSNSSLNGGKNLYIIQTNKSSSELFFSSARKQDSGTYSCVASNRAGADVVNITLLVSSPPEEELNNWGRSLTAGLILGAFAVLTLGLIFCCVFSLRRVRTPKIVRRASEACSPPEKVELLERSQSLVDKQAEKPAERNTKSSVKAVETASILPLIDKTQPVTADDEHRPLALHRVSQVSFEQLPSKTSPTCDEPTFKNAAVSPIGELYPEPLIVQHTQYPDIVEDATALPLAQCQPVRYRSLPRRPLSEWDVASDISWIEMEPDYRLVPSGENLPEIDWYSRRDSNGDFQRRYEYHTQQLDRFLSEYKALQRRLANLHDVCARWSIPAQENRTPLRPILKYPSSVDRFGSLERHGKLQRRLSYYDDQFR